MKVSRPNQQQAPAAASGKASRPIGAARGGSVAQPFPKGGGAAPAATHSTHSSSHGQHASPTQTQPRKATGGLGAEFRRQVAGGDGGGAAADQRSTSGVAINDPVGPIREELARKIQSGAANGDSLSWRGLRRLAPAPGHP
jgi:hypothetical protein